MPIIVTIDVIETAKAPGKSQPTVWLSSRPRLQFAQEAMQARTADAENEMNSPMQRRARAASNRRTTSAWREGPNAKQAARDRPKDIKSHRHSVRTMGQEMEREECDMTTAYKAESNNPARAIQSQFAGYLARGGRMLAASDVRASRVSGRRSSLIPGSIPRSQRQRKFGNRSDVLCERWPG